MSTDTTPTQDDDWAAWNEEDDEGWCPECGIRPSGLGMELCEECWAPFADGTDQEN
jgi:hypothetical protein